MITIDEFINALESNSIKYKNNTCQCPAHGGEDLNLSFKQDGDKLLLHCHSYGCEFTDILDSLNLRENTNYTPPPPKPKAQWEIKKEERKKDYFINLMQEHISDMHYADPWPMNGYFKSRGIKNINLRSDIGYIEKCRYAENEYYQAIFALVRDRFGNVITGHRTFLKDGKVFHRGLMPATHQGISNGCAIRAINSQTSKTLIVCEGLETLLSVYMLNGGRDANYWSTINSNGMKTLSIPSHFDTIEIYSDLDRSMTGQNAATELSKRYDARIFYPSRTIPDGKKGVDFNDLIQ